MDLLDPTNAPFIAKLTAKTSSSGVWLYSWEEYQGQATSATRIQAYPGRQGSSTISPARELNNQETDINVLVLMWCRGMVDGQLAYEFAAPDGSLSTDGIAVKEQDGSPSYTSTMTIEVNQDDGLTLTQPSTSTVLMSIADASATQAGIVSTGAQVIAGSKDLTGAVLTIGTPSSDAQVHLRGAAVIYTINEPGPTIVGSITFPTGRLVLSPAHGSGTGSLDLISTGSGKAKLASGGVFAVGTADGVTGTDALGNAFTGGLCTTVGGGSIPTAYTDEMARDAIGTALTNGTGISITVNDGADTITIATTITQYTDEMARDALGTALTEGYLIDITVNDGSDTITLEKKFRGCRAYRSSTGASPGYGPAWGSVAFDAENYDTDTIHDNSTNNSRFTVPTGMGGYWRFSGRIYPDSAGNVAGTVVQVRLLLNGTTVLDQIITEIEPSGSIPISIVQTVRSFSAGDYVELQMYHTGAGAMTYYNNDILTWMECEFQGVAP